MKFFGRSLWLQGLSDGYSDAWSYSCEAQGIVLMTESRKDEHTSCNQRALVFLKMLIMIGETYAKLFKTTENNDNVFPWHPWAWRGPGI